MDHDTRQLSLQCNIMSEKVKEVIKEASQEYQVHGPLFMEYIKKTYYSNYVERLSVQAARKVWEYLVAVRDKLKDESEFENKKNLDGSVRSLNMELVITCIDQFIELKDQGT